MITISRPLNLKLVWLRAKFGFKRLHLRHAFRLHLAVAMIVGAMGVGLGLFLSRESRGVFAVQGPAPLKSHQVADPVSNSPLEIHLPLRAIAHMAEKATVIVRTQKRLGSGFFIGPDLLLTNYHVVNGARKIFVRPTNSRRKIEIQEVVGHEEASDLILLRTKSKVSHWLHVASDEQHSLGERVYAYGAPKGLEGTFTEGVLSNVRQRRGLRVFQITAPISTGSSGGPVLNRKGEVIGVSTAIVKGAQNLNVVMPIQNLSTLVSNLILSGGRASLQEEKLFRPLFRKHCEVLTQVDLSTEHFLEIKKNDFDESSMGRECSKRVGRCYRSAYRYQEGIMSYFYVGVRTSSTTTADSFDASAQSWEEDSDFATDPSGQSLMVVSSPSSEYLDSRGERIGVVKGRRTQERTYHVKMRTGCDLKMVVGVQSSSRRLTEAQARTLETTLRSLSNLVESQLERRLLPSRAFGNQKVAWFGIEDPSPSETLAAGLSRESWRASAPSHHLSQ